jgi:hypothetical protein
MLSQLATEEIMCYYSMRSRELRVVHGTVLAKYDSVLLNVGNQITVTPDLPDISLSS